jgi:hypothetical protein
MPPSVALRRLGPRMPDSLSRQPQRCRHTSTPEICLLIVLDPPDCPPKP